MPRSKVSKIRMFRDSSFLNKNRIKNNYLKKFHVAKKNICESNSVSGAHLEFLLWCYDLEFFTIDYAAKEYEMDRRNMAERYIYVLMGSEYLYKHFDKLTPSKSLEDHIFRDETKYNYRVRYALSQKGRLFVQRFYSML